MSTFAVYALDDRAVVDESTPLLQEGPVFQRSRVRAEQAVWAAGARGLPVTVLRAPNILGVHPTSTWSVLLAQRILKGEFPELRALVISGAWRVGGRDALGYARELGATVAMLKPAEPGVVLKAVGELLALGP